MAEETGIIVIKASEKIHALFHEDKLEEGLKKLAVFANVDPEVFTTYSWAVDSVKDRAGYIGLSYQIGNWIEISNEFLKNASGIEYYAYLSNEYGGQYFYSIPNDSEKYHVEFEFDSDIMEYEDYQEEIRGQLQELVESIPPAVRKVFPDIGEIDIEVLVGNY